MDELLKSFEAEDWRGAINTAMNLRKLIAEEGSSSRIHALRPSTLIALLDILILYATKQYEST